MSRKAVRIITLCALCTFAPSLYSAEEENDEARNLFELANGLYLRGPVYYGQAIIQYKEFLRRYHNDKRCDDAMFFLGKCLRKQGKYEEALQVFLNHRKFKGSPKRDEANLRTGQVYFSLGTYPEAIQYLLKVYDKKEVEESLAKSSALWLGRAYLNSSQPQKAIRALAGVADGKENPWVPYANFYLGRAYRDAGNFEKAIERFEKAGATLSEKNTKAESLFMVAESYANLKKYEKAYLAYRRLVEKHPGSPFRGQAAFGAVSSLHRRKDYVGAIEVHKICQKFIPPDLQAETAYILANSYYNTDKPEEAMDAYREVSKDYPKSRFAPLADYEACFCLFLDDKFDAVIVSGKDFVKKYPSYPEIGNIHFLIAESLYKQVRIKEARAQYQVVVAQYSKSLFFKDASFKVGECYFKEKELGKARKTFREFATIYPTSKWAVKALSRAAECGLELARKAKPELQQAQYEEVARDRKALYEALVERDPKDVLAGQTLFLLGVTYLKLNRYDDMAKAFGKLVEAYPKNQNLAEAYYWLAVQSEKAKQYDIAIGYFERSLALNPKGLYSDRAKLRLADAYYKRDDKDDKEKAASLIVELLRSDPQSDVAAQAHLWTGEFHLEKGNYDEAMEVYNLFIKKFKGNGLLERAYYGLGDCHFKKEEWQKAIDNFTKAIAFKGDSISLSRLHSGIAHFKLGRNKQARELLSEVARSGRRELKAKAIRSLGNIEFDLAQVMKTPEKKRKQYNLARRNYITVVIVHNESEVRPECMYRAAECLEQEGLLSKDEKLLQESKKLLRELMAEYPDNEFAKKARERLETAPAAASGE